MKAFEVIPAVDIREGKCVRLYRGMKGSEKVYSDDPVSVALKWEEEGAGRLHVVDLDGAFEGLPRNLDVVERIVSSVSVPVQFGGGVRTADAVKKLFELGVDRVILGTMAVRERDLVVELAEIFPKRIAIGVDVRDRSVAIRGWCEDSGISSDEFVRWYRSAKIWGFVYTDVTRDGTLKGLNLEEIERFALSAGRKVIVAGGVSSIDDIKALKGIKNVCGVILGKSLYEGKITLREALLLES